MRNAGGYINCGYPSLWRTSSSPFTCTRLGPLISGYALASYYLISDNACAGASSKDANVLVVAGELHQMPVYGDIAR
jgi:hypothetical protein